MIRRDWDFCGVAPRMVVQKPIKLTDDVSEGFMHKSNDLNFNEAESFTGLGLSVWWRTSSTSTEKSRTVHPTAQPP